MKQFLAPAILGLALTGCMSTGMWSEAPRDDYYSDAGYALQGAPVGWWGSNVASVDVFYGSLAPYGRWDSYPGYGRVFIPAGVGHGWQPYSRGYWMNDPRHGRRWVSSEPFGWATYHYGRWGRDSRLGWFWVPDTRFGASWVDWRRTGGYDSWAPLPPIGWERHARSGYGWGNDWWLHAPTSYAWRPGYQQHVRPGRPGTINNPPGIARPRPGRDGVRDGRHPRSDGWQRAERPRTDAVGEGRHPRSGQWQGGQRPPTADIRTRTPRVEGGESRPPRSEAGQPRGQRGEGFQRRAPRPPRQSMAPQAAPQQAAAPRPAPVHAAPPPRAARESIPRMSPRSVDSGSGRNPD